MKSSVIIFLVVLFSISVALAEDRMVNLSLKASETKDITVEYNLYRNTPGGPFPFILVDGVKPKLTNDKERVECSLMVPSEGDPIFVMTALTAVGIESGISSFLTPNRSISVNTITLLE